MKATNVQKLKTPRLQIWKRQLDKLINISRRHLDISEEFTAVQQRYCDMLQEARISLRTVIAEEQARAPKKASKRR